MSKHYKGDAAKDEVLLFDVPKVKEKSLDYLTIERQLKHLTGEILTIIDASFTDPIQKKAIKDLVKDKFSAQLSWVYELCGYPSGSIPALMDPDGEVRAR